MSFKCRTFLSPGEAAHPFFRRKKDPPGLRRISEQSHAVPTRGKSRTIIPNRLLERQFRGRFLLLLPSSPYSSLFAVGRLFLPRKSNRICSENKLENALQRSSALAKHLTGEDLPAIYTFHFNSSFNITL